MYKNANLLGPYDVSENLLHNFGGTKKLEEIRKHSIATLLLWRHPHALLFGKLDKLVAVKFSGAHLKLWSQWGTP